MKVQVEKDKALEWRRMKAQSFSLGSLLNQYQTYQGNPCGIYPDLSSFTGSGVYPNLSSFIGIGVIQNLRRAGNNGGVYHQLDGFQRLLLDAVTTQMQRLLKRNNEKLYRRIEGLEHQMNPNAGRPSGGNRRVNDGLNRIEGQDRIEGVKLNVSSFKGRSDPDAYLTWEMKIQHTFSYNDYPEEQKVKLAAATFSDYALTEMRRVMRNRYAPTSYSRTTRQKLQRLSQGSLIVEEYYKEMEMTLVRANIEEDTKAYHDHKSILKPLSLREVCDDQIRRREKREQERDNSEAPQRNRKRKSGTLERWSDTQERESNNSNQLTIYVSPGVQPLLQEFKDVFPKEIPHGLPPSRNIEHQKRKEVVLEPGDDPGHLRANVFQEGGNDENPETGQIQAKGPSGEG
ncbi:hypothetical protein HKD37_17G048822 [Glycine soja]